MRRIIDATQEPVSSSRFNPISIKHLAKNLELASYERDWRQMKRGQLSTGCCAPAHGDPLMKLHKMLMKVAARVRLASSL